jgi:hypothetical protein
LRLGRRTGGGDPLLLLSLAGGLRLLGSFGGSQPAITQVLVVLEKRGSVYAGIVDRGNGVL